MKQYTGVFITLEGTEGAGKSTNLTFINQWLVNNNIATITTREPGGTNIGEAIRNVLLDTNNKEMNAETELMLMFSARNQHVQEKIIPALKKGQWVISDRFTDSSYAYQGAARGIEYQRIEELEKWVLQDFKPDMTFVFDLSVEEGMQRLKSRGNKKDRFEREEIVFFEKVRNSYLNRAKQLPNKYTIIDASKSLSIVQNQIEGVLNKLITEYKA